MLNIIRLIIASFMVKVSVPHAEEYSDYYTLYFYHVRNSKLSTKRTHSTWYATVPSTWKGKPLVRTSVRIDRRMYNSASSTLIGHSVTFYGAEHKHFVRTAKEVM